MGTSIFDVQQPFDYSHQAFEVPGTRRSGQTGHYRAAFYPDLLSLSSPTAPFRTIPELLDWCIKTWGAHSPLLGHLPLVIPPTTAQPAKYAEHYVWRTYGEVYKQKRDLGAGIDLLFERGELKANDEGMEVAGLWSVNRPEWQILDFALLSYGRVDVSLYETQGVDGVEYIINHAQLPIIFASANHITSLLALASKCFCLKMVVSMDELGPMALGVAQSWANEVGIKFMTLSEVEDLGRRNPRDERLPQSDDVATISYTSGTSGSPKGVVLSHRNLCHSTYIGAIGGQITAEGRILSYLPVAHVYGRMSDLRTMLRGRGIGYSTGDLSRLFQDCRILKPTSFAAVPRILNRLYAMVKAQIEADGVAGKVLRRGVEAKIRNFNETGALVHPVWDVLAMNKLKALLGGQIQTLSCGSAPVASEVLDVLRVAFSCNVVEGYGMTENFGTTCRTLEGDTKGGGTVGPPQPGVEIKLVDVPEMGYTSLDQPNPRGELCMRGENRFLCYYKDAKTTQSTIDEEGFLHTGDVGEVDEAGRFKIIDRMKNIVKLAQGEFVALENVQNAYSTCPIVAQIYVHADSLRDHLVAVVVPDPQHLAVLASKVLQKHIDSNDSRTLLTAMQTQEVTYAVLDIMNGAAQEYGLRGFETVKRIHMSPEPFTIENDILTPTLKLRRREAYLRYKEELEALYAQRTRITSTKL